MRYTAFLDTPLIRDQSQKRVRALTLVELLVVIAIVGTLAAIGQNLNDGSDCSILDHPLKGSS
jgi:prepilin-type N-terminal cleavage/methylation domain-containing protein